MNKQLKRCSADDLDRVAVSDYTEGHPFHPTPIFIGETIWNTSSDTKTVRKQTKGIIMTNQEIRRIKRLSRWVKGSYAVYKGKPYCIKTVGGVKYGVTIKEELYEVSYPFPAESPRIRFVGITEVVTFFEEKVQLHSLTNVWDDSGVLN